MKFDQNIESRYGIRLVDEFTVRKEARLSTRENFTLVKAIVNHFINHPDPMVVPTYAFKVLQETNEKESNYGTYVYTYDMMRLGMLDSTERTIVDASNQFYHIGLSSDTKNDWIQRGIREYPELIKFMNTVFKQGRYTDIHGGNFMKDDEGNYRIIDLEGFMRAPLNRDENDWITP